MHERKRWVILNKISSIFKKIYSELKDLISLNDIKHYNILMGLISSVLIALVEYLSYFFVDETNLHNPLVYLYSGIWMTLMAIVFFSIVIGDYKISSKFINWLVISHPFIIMLVGITVSYQFQGYSNQIYSFILGLLTASLIQIYPIKKRIILFVLAPLLFNTMMFQYHGNSPIFYENLRLSMMMSIIGYVYTSLQYSVDLKRKNLLAQLEMNSQIQKVSYDELQLAYVHLDRSHKITEGMMKITTQILENDQFDDVLQLVLEEAIKVVPKAQAGSILIFNGEVMEYRAAFGYSLENLQKITLKVKDLFQSHFEDMYEPEIIKDLKVFDEAHVDGETVKKLNEQGALVAQSILTCSFEYDNQFYGLINLDNFESMTIYDDSDKRMIKHLAKQIEITIAIHKLFGKAMTQTRYDALTQAVTRRYHQELLTKCYEESKKAKTPFVICSIDLNNLKDINDRFGHNFGDEALRLFSSSIRKRKETEVIFSRVGGDEFILVYPKMEGIEVQKLMEELRTYHLDNPLLINNEEVVVSFAYGVATYPYDSDLLEELVNMSDQRMYENKAYIKRKNNNK